MALRVEVVLALPGGLEHSWVELAAGATLGDAIRASGILQRHPEVQLEAQKVGVFGTICSAATRAKDGDRVEIYRVLAADPKEARRRRAAASRRQKTRV